MLVRHYIHQRLKEYYAQSATSVVGGISPINFNSLWNEYHWETTYAKLYRQQSGQWLTPSELFQPYYSHCIAEWVASRCYSIVSPSPSSLRGQQHKKRIRVVELGGGRGTNAICVLDYLKRCHRIVYDQIGKYILVDSSPSLLSLQQERTTKEYCRHADLLSYRLCDIRDVAEQEPQQRDSFLKDDDESEGEEEEDQLTIVLALEVLDNLPHDRIRQGPRRGGDNNNNKNYGNYFQIDLERTTNGRYQEIERPLTDPLLQRCLSLTASTTPTTAPPSLRGGIQPPQWYPSVAIGLLDHLLSHGSSSSNSSAGSPSPVEILVADFDMLPGGNPLVTDMEKTDYDHYLQPPNSPTDILFATDFELLATACRNHHHVHHRPPTASTTSSTAIAPPPLNVAVTKQGDFLRRYPHIVRHTKTMFGFFNPMVDLFSNCSILTVERGVVP